MREPVDCEIAHRRPKVRLEEAHVGSLSDIIIAIIPGLGSMIAADGLSEVFLGSVEGSIGTPPA
ncbi:hypothetical protein [Rhodococcus sp. NPDC003348]